MADFDLAKERAKFLGVFPNAHWTDGATCPDQTWAINTWQGWQAARRQHGSEAQAVEPVAEMYLRMMNWNGRGRPDDPPPTPFVDVRWFNRDLPAGTKLYTAPPVADAEGVKGKTAAQWYVAYCEKSEQLKAADGAINRYAQRVTELEAALSRRPAAAAEELAPQDVSVLRRWAEQIERMASVFNDERSLLCQQAAILLHRIAYRPAEVAAEQPAAAGNALTDEHRTAVRDALADALGEAYDCTRVWSAWGVGTMGPDDFVLVAEDDERLDELTNAAISAVIAINMTQHSLRAAPQAAQGKGLTIDTPQFRVLVSSVAWESRTAPSDAFEAALNRLIAHIDQTIAAHTRASDGEDSERLDFLATNEAWIAWTKDGESCRVFHRNEDGDCEPIMGWVPEAWAHSPREAIDAAMQQAASTSAEGAHGEAK